MKTQETMSTSSAAYLLFGAAIGATLGLLFAPKKGSELRDELSEMGKDVGETGRRLFSQVSGAIPNQVKVAGAVGAVKGAGSEALREAREQINSALRG